MINCFCDAVLTRYNVASHSSSVNNSTASATTTTTTTTVAKTITTLSPCTATSASEFNVWLTSALKNLKQTDSTPLQAVFHAYCQQLSPAFGSVSAGDNDGAALAFPLTSTVSAWFGRQRSADHFTNIVKHIGYWQQAGLVFATNHHHHHHHHHQQQQQQQKVLLSLSTWVSQFVAVVFQRCHAAHIQRVNTLLLSMIGIDKFDSTRDEDEDEEHIPQWKVPSVPSRQTYSNRLRRPDVGSQLLYRSIRFPPRKWVRTVYFTFLRPLIFF